MVRTYKPKNKYCRNTKISEDAFLRMFYGYMEGKSVKETQQFFYDEEDRKYAYSRQAIEGIYLRLGKYLWEDYVQPKLATLYDDYELSDECPSVDHLIVYYLDMMRQSIEGTIDYQSYRYDNIEIGNMGTVKRLIERSKLFNGLPAKTFHYHFAYVSFIDTMHEEVNKGHFTWNDIYMMLLSDLEKNPL